MNQSNFSYLDTAAHLAGEADYDYRQLNSAAHLAGATAYKYRYLNSGVSPVVV